VAVRRRGQDFAVSDISADLKARLAEVKAHASLPAKNCFGGDTISASNAEVSGAI
jgi:hypothetical protein